MTRFPLQQLFLPVILAAVAHAGGSRREQWKQVEEALQKRLPKTAIKLLTPIAAQALKEKAYAEAIKAIGYRIACESRKVEERIRKLQAELAKLPRQMRPVTEAILAHWYWQYYRQNRWRILRRTQRREAPGEDFTTWDVPRLLGEIGHRLSEACKAKTFLEAIPISTYDALLLKGTMPDACRPTLYDFLVYEAIDFYSLGEQAAVRPQDAFTLDAESPVFAPVEEFMKWTIPTPDTESPTVKALRLYQELLRFHRNDKDETAFLEANLSRLIFGYNTASGEKKNERFKAALKHFVKTCPEEPITARAFYRWASVLRAEQRLVEAHKLAREGKNRFPTSPGGKLCHNLIQRIEARSLAVSTERVWTDPWPTIDIRYRNLTKVYFQVVPADWEAIFKENPSLTRPLPVKGREALLALKPARQWPVDLPPTEDYRERVHSVPAPRDLAPGFYYLIASARPDFTREDNVVSATGVWVSDIALVVRTRSREPALEGLVLNAQSGEPLGGASVRLWVVRGRKPTLGGTTQTDENGLFRFAGLTPTRYVVDVQYRNQRLTSHAPSYVSRSRRRRGPSEQTIFFTDRSLYRPGQIIHYKGIAIRVDQENDRYCVISGRAVTVALVDRNGKKVAENRHRTNDYGSFSGSFVAPRGTLTGRMRIRVTQGPRGATGVNVEEYKRPKFQVALTPPATAVRLNDEVLLKGKATAYTGAAIDNATVTYRVVRAVRYPEWWEWFYWWRPRRGTSAEIARGTTRTGPDGSFTIRFRARPDPSVSEEEEPVFQFRLTADVTDTAGETRSGYLTVNVGYTALAASLHAPAWQVSEEPIPLTVETTTLDGEPQQAEGVLKVYRLKEPDRPVRAPLRPRYGPWWRASREPEKSSGMWKPANWPLGKVVFEKGVHTGGEGTAVVPVRLQVGAYRAVFETQDRFGNAVRALLPLLVVDPKAPKLAVPLCDLFRIQKQQVEPGEEFVALWASGYAQARAYVEVEHRGKILKALWTPPGVTQYLLRVPVTEKFRGGFIVRVTFVRENRAYLHSEKISVPWTNKDLTVKWKHFTSKLKPKAQETWTAVITGPGAMRAVAEMVATLYDASLDAYLPHNWITRFTSFREEYPRLSSRFQCSYGRLYRMLGEWKTDVRGVRIQYRTFPSFLVQTGFSDYARRADWLLGRAQYARLDKGQAVFTFGLGPEANAAGAPLAKGRGVEAGLVAPPEGKGPLPQPPGAAVDLAAVQARKNLQETAFFFPHLLSDKEGVVELRFVMPEALTQWKFMGFAHDKSLRSGYLQDTAVTAKDLMVQPNPPRFLREGDVLHFTVKVLNQSPTRQKGIVRLTFSDARTEQDVTAKLGITETDKAFDIPSKESRSFSWRLTIPDAMGFLAYKAVASTGRLSDGEEGYVPVLSRRILLTESLPLPVRGPATKHFRFERLARSGRSDTLRHQCLVVQVCSNPAWYAVMALPYLMEFPYECTEQTFNRVYANSLAHLIVRSSPRIRSIFEQWRGTKTLESPLLKNHDLKAVILEETPWLRQAISESQARKNVGILFEENRLRSELAQALRKLRDVQRGDGAWPWFPGGPPCDYITLYITTGFGRLRHLGVDLDVSCALKALARLDNWITKKYRRILEHGKKESNHLTPIVAFYLYGRSFFLKDRPIDPKHTPAVEYFLTQAKRYWPELGCRQSEGHLAVALKRFGDIATARAIVRSLKERATVGEELGMYWRDAERSWWWYRAPIETQAVMIEAFDEVAGDAEAVEACKVWLLKQKQTQDWKTTKATADAVYALLLRGADLLSSKALLEVKLGPTAIKPQNVEAGTGYYEHRLVGPEITPQLASVTVKKVDPGIAWGAVTWQYLEDMKKVTPFTGTPLALKKRLFVEVLTKRGPVLTPVEGPLSVGQKLVVRIVLRVDRDMEYVHLKDQRPSGTEPTSVLSGYRYQDGLRYYESTRDTASHFFIDYLPKGTYVFEYSTRVVHRGTYQSGVARIQCMYAPEFNSHSESAVLTVR